MRKTSKRRKNTPINQKAVGKTKIIGDEYEFVPLEKTDKNANFEARVFDAYQVEMYKLVDLKTALHNVNKYLNVDINMRTIRYYIHIGKLILPDSQGSMVNDTGTYSKAYFESDIYPILISHVRKITSSF